MSKFIGFRTPYEKDFLVFGVPNAKYLAFGTPNGNALIIMVSTLIKTNICSTRKNKSEFYYIAILTTMHYTIEWEDH